MQKIHYVKCYPAGNTTVLVLDLCPRSRHAEISNRIMEIQPDVEQVGFVESPDNPQAKARLQMAGGEFCGNATRSLAYVVARDGVNGIKPDAEEFYLEVSGAKNILKVRVKGNQARVAMPISSGANAIKQMNGMTAVELDGITHVVIQQNPPQDLKKEASKILQSCGLVTSQSAGVIYSMEYVDGIQITPVVWVRDTGTLIAETACGSGTISAAYVEATGRSIEGEIHIPVYQPSGKIISAILTLQNGCLMDAFIDGSVEIIEAGKVTI